MMKPDEIRTTIRLKDPDLVRFIRSQKDEGRDLVEALTYAYHRMRALERENEVLRQALGTQRTAQPMPQDKSATSDTDWSWGEE